MMITMISHMFYDNGNIKKELTNATQTYQRNELIRHDRLWKNCNGEPQYNRPV
jgi:hypothetical protein